MTRPTRRQLVLLAAALLVLAAVVFAFLPGSIPVDTAPVTRGPLQVTVEEEGETHLADRYVITAPVAAYARRIELEEGDRVERGQAVVKLEPPRAAILDPRSQAEAAARVRVARAAADEAEVVLARAAADRDRIEALHAGGAVAEQQLEQARADAARATSALAAAEAELAAARAAAGGGARGGGSVPAEVRAPAAGRVLTVHHRSGGAVSPGQPLLEIGDTQRLEIRADVLSQDAVRIQPGTRVIVDQWGGDTTLQAVVTRVEPEGVTEVSALGVEEQRVPVRADLTSPPAQWAALGSGYRVLARFVIWEGDDVLQIPSSALFRADSGWAVFVVTDGRAERRPVAVGQQAGLAAQVLDGLEAGDRVVVHPPNDLEDGARVRVR